MTKDVAIEELRERPLSEHDNLLILVDQFEESFRYRDLASREEAEAFVAQRQQDVGACVPVRDAARWLEVLEYVDPRIVDGQRGGRLHNQSRARMKGTGKTYPFVYRAPKPRYGHPRGGVLLCGQLRRTS